MFLYYFMNKERYESVSNSVQILNIFVPPLVVRKSVNNNFAPSYQQKQSGCFNAQSRDKNPINCAT